MAQLDFVVPRKAVKETEPPGLRGLERAEAGAYGVRERCIEAGMDNVYASTMLPNGSVRVWGEAGGTRPATKRDAYEQGWERIFRKDCK